MLKGREVKPAFREMGEYFTNPALLRRGEGLAKSYGMEYLLVHFCDEKRRNRATKMIDNG